MHTDVFTSWLTDLIDDRYATQSVGARKLQFLRFVMYVSARAGFQKNYTRKGQMSVEIQRRLINRQIFKAICPSY